MKRALPLIAIAASLAAGCGGKHSPVARVEVAPRQVLLPFGYAQKLRLAWHPNAPLEEQPTVFIHLLDEERNVLRTFDHAFPQRWREGVPVSYEVELYQSAMAPPLPAGKYRLTLGLYGKDGKRWVLDGLGEPRSRNEYDVGQVDVPPQHPNPRLAFSPNWLPLEPGGDRQVLARRWMAERAVIRLVNQRNAGTVWMVVHLPPTDLPENKLTLDPGATTPAVRVTGSCGGNEMNLTGSGNHEVELAMESPPPGGFCRILLSTNFVLQPAVGRNRSVSLENIAWIPSGGGQRAHKRRDRGAGAGAPANPTAPQ